MGDRKKVSAGHRADKPAVFDSYGRLSKAPDTGEFEKIETQWADNRTVIDRLGGVLGEELEDGLSAWKKNVRRPGWETLLERARTGKSNGIVANIHLLRSVLVGRGVMAGQRMLGGW